MGVPVETGRAPFKVPVDHIHLFDVRVPIIREAFQDTLDDAELAAKLRTFNEIRKAAPPPDEFSRWNSRMADPASVPGFLQGMWQRRLVPRDGVEPPTPAFSGLAPPETI
jgi:hypothetical protein